MAVEKLDWDEQLKDWNQFFLKNPNWSKATFSSIKARDSFFNFIQYFISCADYSLYRNDRFKTIIKWLSEKRE
jgi:hypothetical protein